MPFPLSGWIFHLVKWKMDFSFANWWTLVRLFKIYLKRHLFYKAFLEYPKKRNHFLLGPHCTISRLVFVTLHHCNSLTTCSSTFLHLCNPSFGILSTGRVCPLLWYCFAGKNAKNPVKKAFIIHQFIHLSTDSEYFITSKRALHLLSNLIIQLRHWDSER